MYDCSGLANWVYDRLGKPPGYTVGHTMFIFDPEGEITLKHEMGHPIQYETLGDLFWSAYGAGILGGVISCRSFDNVCVHNKNFMEWWAR